MTTTTEKKTGKEQVNLGSNQDRKGDTNSCQDKSMLGTIKQDVCYDSDDFDTDLEEMSIHEDDEMIRSRKQTQLLQTPSTARYLQMCESVQAVPSTKFLQQIDHPDVCMRYYGLRPKGAKAIALEMIWNNNITKLDLTDTLLGDRGGMFIADMLRDNKHLKDLNMSNNDIGWKTLNALSEASVENATLTYLNLSRNGLTDKLIVPFITALQDNATLKELDLSFNDLSESTGTGLGTLLATNRHIEVLRLGWNAIRLAGPTSIGNALRKNKSLKILDLSNNGLDDHSARSIGESLKVNNSLLELDISNNRLTGRGFECIAKGLQQNKGLQVLKCGNNPVALSSSQADPVALIKALQSNKSSALIELHLDEVYPNKEFQDELQDLVKSRKTLRVYSGHEKLDSKMEMFLSVKKEKPSAKLVEYMYKHDQSSSEVFRLLGSVNGVSVDKKTFIEKLQSLPDMLNVQQIECFINALKCEGEKDINFVDFVKQIDSYKSSK